MIKKELFIFDMDGLMFDTERLVYECYLETAKIHGFEVKPEIFNHVLGKTQGDIIKTLQYIYEVEEEVVKWRKDIVDLKFQLIEERKTVRKKTGLLEILNFAKEQQIKTAVASSSKRKVIDLYLGLEDITPYIDVIVAGDEVSNGKPNPEIFLTACHKSGVSPDKAIVMEDSPAGINAALNAKITSFHIKDDLSDMPSVNGPIKIAKNIKELILPSLKPDYRVKSLLDVRDFMQTHELTI